MFQFCEPLTSRAFDLLLQRLVICLESSLFVHNIHDMKVLHRICDTPLNSRGICALSASSAGTDGYLAYPGSVDVGEIQVFDAIALVCDLSLYIIVIYGQNCHKLLTISKYPAAYWLRDSNSPDLFVDSGTI